MNRLTQKNSLGCIYFQVVVGMRNEISECFDMRNIDFLKKWIVVVNILNGFFKKLYSLLPYSSFKFDQEA